MGRIQAKMIETEQNHEETSDAETYVGMFRAYVAAQDWITDADKPLVFHLKKLCARLDADLEAPAALNSAYLQALSRLDKRRPGAKPDPAGDPAQTTVFDFLD